MKVSSCSVYETRWFLSRVHVVRFTGCWGDVCGKGRVFRGEHEFSIEYPHAGRQARRQARTAVHGRARAHARTRGHARTHAHTGPPTPTTLTPTPGSLCILDAPDNSNRFQDKKILYI